MNAAERVQLRERFLNVDTATVADVLDTLGLYDQGLASIFTPYPADCGRMAGWAYTIRGQMTPYQSNGDPDKMKAVDGCGAGDVTVWSGNGEGVCYFGELIALGMKTRGCVGALLDGGIRDIQWIARQKFPVYARYRTPVQSIGRWKVTGWHIPVYMAGATSARVAVNPGDLIHADIDGVIVVPAAQCERVIAEAERLTATEVKIRKELDAGATLAQVLDIYGHV